MQVRSKDAKHLFSLDNLLDFLHKKADITDRLKQHLFSTVKNPRHLLLYHEDGVEEEKTRGNGTDTETKDREEGK